MYKVMCVVMVRGAVVRDSGSASNDGRDLISCGLDLRILALVVFGDFQKACVEHCVINSAFCR